MKRWFVAALVLAVMQCSAAWAWIPIGQTDPEGGVVWFAADNWATTARSPSGNFMIGFEWYYPGQIMAEVGEDSNFFFEAYGSLSDPPSIDWYLTYDVIPGTGGPIVNYALVQGSVVSYTFTQNGNQAYFAAELLSDGTVLNLRDGASKPLSAFGMTNNFRLEGTLTYAGSLTVPNQGTGPFFQGPMVLSIQPIPEPVFFQMGALMGLSGLGLLRLRRKA